MKRLTLFLVLLSHALSAKGVELSIQRVRKGIDEGQFKGKIDVDQLCRVQLDSSLKKMLRLTTRSVTFDYTPQVASEFISGRIMLFVDKEKKAEVPLVEPRKPEVVVKADDEKRILKLRVAGKIVDVDPALVTGVADKIDLLLRSDELEEISSESIPGVKDSLADLVSASPYVTYWKVKGEDGQTRLILRNLEMTKAAKLSLLAQNPSLEFSTKGSGFEELKTHVTSKAGKLPEPLAEAIRYLTSITSHACADR